MRGVRGRWLRRQPLRRVSDERGSALVLVALMLATLLGTVALVTDAGLLYLHRMSLVDAVDAAALAGVQELPHNPGAARARGQDYALFNGADAGSVETEVSADRTELTVRAARRVQLFFARAIGIREARVAAAATARVGGVGGYGGGAVPFGVVDQEFVYGRQYMLKYGAGPGEGRYRGNFAALALGGRGAIRYRDNIRYGYDGMLRIGDWVPTEPGDMAGPTADGVRHRMDSDPHHPACTWDNVRPGCTRVVVGPVIGSLEGNGRGEVEIVGFAAFFLEGTGRRGSDSYLIGRFIRMAVDGEHGDPARDYGTYSYRLVR